MQLLDETFAALLNAEDDSDEDDWKQDKMKKQSPSKAEGPPERGENGEKRYDYKPSYSSMFPDGLDEDGNSTAAAQIDYESEPLDGTTRKFLRKMGHAGIGLLYLLIY